jgi:hypothetical protein
MNALGTLNTVSTEQGYELRRLEGYYEFASLNKMFFALDFCKGPNKQCVSIPSPEDRDISSFQNVVIYSYLEFWTMDEVHKPGDSEFLYFI